MQDTEMQSAKAVIDRLKQILNAHTDAELSERLDVATPTISSWRNRNSVPYDQCIKLSIDYYVNLDWLLAGRGEIYKKDELPLTRVDWALLSNVIEIVEDQSYHLFKVGEPDPKQKAKFIIMVYKMLAAHIEEVVHMGMMTRAEAVKKVPEKHRYLLGVESIDVEAIKKTF